MFKYENVCDRKFLKEGNIEVRTSKLEKEVRVYRRNVIKRVSDLNEATNRVKLASL